VKKEEEEEEEAGRGARQQQQQQQPRKGEVPSSRRGRVACFVVLFGVYV